MRTLELLSITTALSYVLWLSFGSALSDSPFHWLPFIAAGMTILHVAVEGYRWQMIPAYLLTVCLLLLYPWCLAHDFRIRLSYMAMILIGTAVLTGLSGVLGGVLYPVFSFAPLTGKFPVGTVSTHFVDSSRTDPFAAVAGTKRELMVQFWYPADTTKGCRRARYREGRKDNWHTSNLALVKTRSFCDAPIHRSNEKLPLLIFTGPDNRFQNTFETEELASHGFVVAALDHPYDSDLVTFPDGRRIYRRKRNVFLNFDTDETLRESTREVTEDLDVRVADVEFLLERLNSFQAQDHPHPVAAHVNMSKIGVFGHSFGGAVAAELCARNPGIVAGVNMDGWMFGRSQAEGVRQPFFFMVDCTPRPTSDQLNSPDGVEQRTAQRTLEGYEDVERSLNLHGGYYLQTSGLEHMNYSDYPLYSQLKSRTGAGRFDFRRAHQMINRFTLLFFQAYLSSKSGSDFATAPKEFPEANLRIERQRVERAVS